MAPALGSIPTSAATLVDAWVEQGDPRAARDLVALLRDDLVELCDDLGVLYPGPQARQAVHAALHVANPKAAQARWRRRNPGVTADEWAVRPLATFQALAIHALLDNAGVPVVGGRQARMGTADQAALRLQAADVHDLDDAAAWVGLTPGRVADLWEGLVTPPPAVNPARRIAAVLATATLPTFGLGSAMAAASAASVAVVAAIVAIVGVGVFVDRDVPTDPAQPAGTVPTAIPTAPTVVAEPVDQVEGVEAPLPVGDARPGLNVPTVRVDVFGDADLDAWLDDPASLLPPLDVVPSPGGDAPDGGTAVVDPALPEVLPSDELPLPDLPLPTASLPEVEGP